MINRVVLVGRLTRDPELKKSATGNSVCTFTVAVDNRGKTPDGQKTASYIGCIAFAQSADNMSKFLRKGSLVGVEGRLNQRTFQRKDGTNGSVVEVLCDSVQFLEPKGTSNLPDGNPTTFEETPSMDEVKNVETLDLPDDDLPF